MRPRAWSSEPPLATEQEVTNDTTTIDILYVDKNNTPDIWDLNSKILKKIASEESGLSII